jgi:cell division protein ZapA
MTQPRVIRVDVHGHSYPIRTSLDADYVHSLAAFVEERMRLAAESSPSSDALGQAVLAALNIADEYFRSRMPGEGSEDDLATRTARLERIIDQALELAQ